MIAIIKYNAGNTKSVQNALSRLGVNSIVTDDPSEIKQAEKVIFPGVGEAGSAMSYLQQRGLDEVIRNLTQPVLGICLGLQLMCRSSEEGDVKCLGIFDLPVRKFPELDLVPHTGWNAINCSDNPLLAGISSLTDFYFVHSYYAEISDESIATCDYIVPFSAALQKNNFYATQFHPEKSAEAGEQILKNFIAL